MIVAMQGKKDFISICADKVVDVDKAEKDSVRVTDGRVWCTKGMTKMFTSFYLIYI